jgi:hypothetical protein
MLLLTKNSINVSTIPAAVKLQSFLKIVVWAETKEEITKNRQSKIYSKKQGFT